MASNTFTIEICDEDRRRIDALTKAFGDEIGRIVDDVKYVRSQAFWPHMGEFSRGYQTACDEIVARINSRLSAAVLSETERKTGKT